MTTILLEENPEEFSEFKGILEKREKNEFEDTI